MDPTELAWVVEVRVRVRVMVSGFVKGEGWRIQKGKKLDI